MWVGLALNRDEKEATEQDLKQILIDFWLSVIESVDAEYPDRMKASELLAKYILGEGKTAIKRRALAGRPSTAEILRIAAELEEANGE